MVLQEILDVIMTKPHYSPYQVTREIAGLHHPVDRHFIDLQDVCKLSHGVKLPCADLPQLLVASLFWSPHIPPRVLFPIRANFTALLREMTIHLPVRLINTNNYSC